MAKINEFYLDLQGNYLFSDIEKKVAGYVAKHPDKHIIKLGIGDVTRPLPHSVIAALHEAVDEMGQAESFKGYGPYFGYDFLREAIRLHDYQARGIQLDIDEIFISDGAKSDTGNIGDIFSRDNKVAISDPVYTVYLDTNVMAGRAGRYEDGKYSKILYMPCLEENGFLPQIPQAKADMVYLCFPNNPTGVTADKAYLKKWVDYANEHEAVILYDSAYEAFIQDHTVPRSIFEIEGAKTCAIEFRSFSKTAGFTGTRCAYTVVPKELRQNKANLNSLWQRRLTTKFNGVPYIIQRGAAAVYTPEGQKEIQNSIRYYMENAKIIASGLKQAGLAVFGGDNAPYIWAKIPEHMDSWSFFDYLLEKAGVVTTPGAGFGLCGEGYIRLTAFGSRENTEQAVLRVQEALRS